MGGPDDRLVIPVSESLHATPRLPPSSWGRRRSAAMWFAMSVDERADSDGPEGGPMVEWTDLEVEQEDDPTYADDAAGRQ